MKKQIIILSIAILTVTTIFAQADTAMRKGKKQIINSDPPPYNPIPPVDLSSAPKDANFFEISITKTGTINGKGIKKTGVRGLEPGNVAGKINLAGITKEELENNKTGQLKWDGGNLSRCCKTTCCCLKNNADGKIYELPLNSDGTFNGNVPEGEYTMIYAGNIIATKCGVRGNPIAVKMNGGPAIKN